MNKEDKIQALENKIDDFIKYCDARFYTLQQLEKKLLVLEKNQAGGDKAKKDHQE